jgi:hypothetical protein
VNVVALHGGYLVGLLVWQVATLEDVGDVFVTRGSACMHLYVFVQTLEPASCCTAHTQAGTHDAMHDAVGWSKQVVQNIKRHLEFETDGLVPGATPDPVTRCALATWLPLARLGSNVIIRPQSTVAQVVLISPPPSSCLPS